MNEIFGQKLRKLRKGQGYTQEQLGELLHVTRQTVSYWETGKSQPDYAMLARIADLFHVPVSEFLEDETQQAETPHFPIPDRIDNPPAQEPAICWRSIALFSLILFLILLTVLIYCRRPKTNQFSIEWFSQAQEAQAGQAYLELYTRETPVFPSRGVPGADAFWKYPLFIKETNGVSIAVERLTYVTFYRDGSTSVDSQMVDIFHENVGMSVIGANEIRVITQDVPADKNKIGLGILIEGTDENGNQLSFHHFIPYEYDLD